MAVGLLVVGCTSAPALEEVLLPEQSTKQGAARAVPNDPIAEVDHRVRLAVERADEEPENGPSQLAAARALAAAADLRLLVGQLQCVSDADLTVDDWVDLEDDLPAALKSGVHGLVSAGLHYAERAAIHMPSNAEALYLSAFHLSLVAWAEGPAAAVLRGRGPDLAKRMRTLGEQTDGWQAAGLDPSAPWRLRGRFLDRAPWPYGDAKEAIRLLQVATERSHAPINYLFHGDALWSAGRQADAVDAWRRGETAAAPTDNEANARRDLIRARLAAFGSRY